MTKKDFVAIAHTLDANFADLNLVLDMADTLAESNPRFNRVLFILAATENLREATVYNMRRIEKEVTR